MTEILVQIWEIFAGVTLREIVRGFFDVSGVYAFFIALSNSRRIKDIEDRLSRDDGDE